MRIRIIVDRKRYLTAGREYQVLGIEGDWYRVLDDKNEPILVDPKACELTDPTEPPDWIREEIDGELYAYPPALNRVGFFEDYYDKQDQAVREFRLYLREHSESESRGNQGRFLLK